MPIYEYHCNKCDSVTELNRSVAYRDAATPCECGGMFIRKFGVGGVYIR